MIKITFSFAVRFIGYALLPAIISSCSGNNASENQTEAENLPDDIVEMRYDQIQMAGIDTGTIVMKPLAGTIRASGKISVAPNDFATVCAPLGGFIRSANLLPGDAVKKGQTLALIENQEFVDIQESYLEAKSRLEFAEAEFRRHSELYKEDVYSEKNLQQVTADYRSLKSHVTALEQKLALIGINPGDISEDNIIQSVSLQAPIAGYIKSVNVNIGKSISPTDVLFEIVCTENLFLELTLFEKDVNQVAQGQKITFFINNEKEEHKAIITQTGRSVDSDKTFKVYAKVTDGCSNLMPGMYVNAIIEISGDKLPSLPSDAVVSFDDKDYIFVFELNKEEKGFKFTEYRMIEIAKGITNEGYTEVRLKDGSDLIKKGVVTKGAYNLLSAKKNAGEMAC